MQPAMQDAPRGADSDAAKAPRKLRVAALIGDRSPFGQAVLRGVLQSPDAELVMLVYPTQSRWQRFARTVAGPEFDTPIPSAFARAAAIARVADLAGVVRTFGARAARAWAVRSDARADDAPGPTHLPPGVVSPVRVDDANAGWLLDRARGLGVDVVLVGAFPQKLGAGWETLARECALNVHPSALPRGRGANPVWWTIASREHEAGCTVHKLAAEFDVGDVLVQSRRSLAPDVGFEALYNWSLGEAKTCVARALEMLSRGGVTWSPQDESRASLYREPRAIHRKLHWEADAAEVIAGKVVAGGAFVVLRGTPLYVERARVLPAAKFLTNGLRCAPGTVLSYNAESLVVRAVDGVVELAGLTVFGWQVDIRRAILTVGARLE